jgi:acyl carrier protein
METPERTEYGPLQPRHPRTTFVRLLADSIRDHARAIAVVAPHRPGREETEIARIFAEVLKTPCAGRRNNFFDLGGDSLSAAQVLAAINATLGASATQEMLFDCPTVCEFAAAIATGRASGAPELRSQRRPERQT